MFVGLDHQPASSVGRSKLGQLFHQSVVGIELGRLCGGDDEFGLGRGFLPRRVLALELEKDRFIGRATIGRAAEVVAVKRQPRWQVVGRVGDFAVAGTRVSRQSVGVVLAPSGDRGKL